jgi:hypothetical protein
MNTADQTAVTSRSGPGDELPVNPFHALRVSFGMLLGEDDFRTLMGNPRGKQMLHSSWLHGSGVVWGFPVDTADDGRLRVGPGLAVDGVGRELALPSPQCIDVGKWVSEQQKNGRPVSSPKDPGQDSAVTVACLVATADLCPTRPVPALADPCDQQRTHTEPSRLVETVRLELRPQECPARPAAGPYHRVRVLLGLDEVASSDPAGKQAADAIEAVLTSPPAMRARSLLAAFRQMLALDVTDMRPVTAPGDECPALFPVPEDDAAVPLATISISHGLNQDCSVSVTWQADVTVRRGLIATSTIQELACGFAPGLLGGRRGHDAGGPRVIRASVDWEGTDESVIVFDVTRPLSRSSLSRQQVTVTSLGSGGWDREDIDDIDYDGASHVRVKLFQPPSQSHVRLVVRGTGPTPVSGASGIPLAGMDDGEAGTENDGHDAVQRLIRRTS